MHSGGSQQRVAEMILDAHPLPSAPVRRRDSGGAYLEIGRRVSGSTLRELVISYGSSGYIALYEHSPTEGLVRIAAIRHHRETGYRGGR